MKDGRFYLRLSDEERDRFEEVAAALGLKSTSDAIRFVMTEKWRELKGATPNKARRKQR